MGKRGRPRKPGPRKGNRPIADPKFVAPADHVIAARHRFHRFQGGKADQQIYDPIGRAWAVGLLENDRIDPAVLRDAGRKYAMRYWGHYPSAPGVANYEQDIRKGPTAIDGEDPSGERFAKLDSLLSHRNQRQAVHELCVDRHWFPDADPPWLNRLIRNQMGKCIVARLDVLTLRLALDGLMALAGETERRAA